MRRLAVRVGALTALVHTAQCGVRESLATPRVPLSRLPQRLPSSTNALRIGGAEMALYKRQEGKSGAYGASLVEASSNQGEIGGICHRGAPRIEDKQLRNEDLRDPQEGAESARSLRQATAPSAHGATLSICQEAAPLIGVCVSLTLAMPWAQLYNSSLYWDMSCSRPQDDRNRCRLSYQSIRDLLKWKLLTAQELSGRPMVPKQPIEAIHPNATDLSFGATVNTQYLRPRIPGQWAEQSG